MIFNRPEDFIIAPSPAHDRKQHPSAHQSQGQFRHPVGLAGAAATRQKSQVLTPKIANSTGDFNRANVQNVLAMNATPETAHLPDTFYKSNAFSDRQGKSMHSTAINFATNRHSAEYGGEAPKAWQGGRAATANTHKERPSVLAALSGSPAF